jgi:hypothetical protein
LPEAFKQGDVAMSCPRSITFTIPGKNGTGVLVTATEDAGNIDFEVSVVGTGTHLSDLRGLFFHFDESDLGTLQITGGDGLIADTEISANHVSNLKHGVNMNGAAGPFDVASRSELPARGMTSLPAPFTSRWMLQTT